MIKNCITFFPFLSWLIPFFRILTWAKTRKIGSEAPGLAKEAIIGIDKKGVFRKNKGIYVFKLKDQ